MRTRPGEKEVTKGCFASKAHDSLKKSTGNPFGFQPDLTQDPSSASNLFVILSLIREHVGHDLDKFVPGPWHLHTPPTHPLVAIPPFDTPPAHL